MGMSTHIKGFVPPDEKWKSMKIVWDACEAASIDVPDEVIKYFNDERPDPMGVEIDLEKIGCASEWSDDAAREGYEVDLASVPDSVRTIRFYNSY